jgi:hypothetical protein
MMQAEGQGYCGQRTGRKNHIFESFQEGAMRLPPMTTRPWLVVIVVIGLAMGAIVGGLRLKRRQEYFGSIAKRFAACESLCMNAAARLDKFIQAITEGVEMLEKSPDLSGPSPSGLSPLEEMRFRVLDGQDDRTSWARKSAH